MMRRGETRRIATNRSAVHELGGIGQRKRAADDHACRKAEQTCALRMERIAQPADEIRAAEATEVRDRTGESNTRRRCGALQEGRR